MEMLRFAALLLWSWWVGAGWQCEAELLLRTGSVCTAVCTAASVCLRLLGEKKKIVPDFQQDPSDTRSVNRVFSRPVKSCGTSPLSRWDTISGGFRCSLCMFDHVRKWVLCMCAQTLCLPSFKMSLIHLVWSHWCQRIETVRNDETLKRFFSKCNFARRRLEAKPHSKERNWWVLALLTVSLNTSR